MKKARLFKKLSQKKVRCLACQHYCVIASEKTGFCQTRLNQGGELYSLTYGVLNGIQIDPIEKKPLYHFYPGSFCLSFGSYGCNYRCKQCLNWHCSWGKPAKDNLEVLKKKKEKVPIVPPSKIIELAKNQNCPGIAFTYNEPTLWAEYVYDTAKLAKENGLYTVFVTNGYWSKECLDYLAPVIDAVNIDIKGFYLKTYQKMGAFLGKVLEITELALKKYKIFIELTTLVIPGVNDSEEELKKIANWIVKNLGKQIPWHLSRYDPKLAAEESFRKLPYTSLSVLKRAWEIGKEVGLNFVYVWAPPKNWQEKMLAIGDTYCPSCKKLIAKREGWDFENLGIKKIGKKSKCFFCGQDLNFVL